MDCNLSFGRKYNPDSLWRVNMIKFLFKTAYFKKKGIWYMLYVCQKEFQRSVQWKVMETNLGGRGNQRTNAGGISERDC